DKKDNKQIKSHTVETKSGLQTNNATDTKWLSFADTINTGFVISCKYPRNYVIEHFENSVCIGKPIKAVDDGTLTSMDCSIWIDDPTEGNVRPIDTLIQYEVDKLKGNVRQFRDTITIANVKGLSVLLIGKNDQ